MRRPFCPLPGHGVGRNRRQNPIGCCRPKGAVPESPPWVMHSPGLQLDFAQCQRRSSSGVFPASSALGTGLSQRLLARPQSLGARQCTFPNSMRQRAGWLAEANCGAAACILGGALPPWGRAWMFGTPPRREAAAGWSRPPFWYSRCHFEC